MATSSDRQIFWDAAVLQALGRGTPEPDALELADRLLVERDARALSGVSLYEVTLKDPGDRKIQVIKILRELTPGMGLADAKSKAESAPVVIATEVDQETAYTIRSRLAGVGATAQIVMMEIEAGTTPWERLLKPSVFDR